MYEFFYCIRPTDRKSLFLFSIRHDSENWLSTNFRGPGRPAKTDRSISDTAARHYPRSWNERGRPPLADWLAPLFGPTWRDKLIPRWSRGDASSARNLIVMAGRIGIPVGARQLVRQDGGSGGPFYGAQPLQPTQTRAPTGERLPFFDIRESSRRLTPFFNLGALAPK